MLGMLVLASYDCDYCYNVPGFYIPFFGGGHGSSVLEGMFAFTIHSGAQGRVPYLGACLMIVIGLIQYLNESL